MIDTAHIHVMIVHLPIMGTVLAMIPLIWWFWKKDLSIQWMGLILLAISLIAIPIATSSGESAEVGFSNGSISASLDEVGMQILSIHAEAAEIAAAFGYALLAIIALQLFFWKRDYTWKNRLFVLTLIANSLLILGLSYVGYLGGQIRHPEFRSTMSGEITTPLVKK